ncbi:MAG: SUMF1/EgtB/PvdO family nonheme iron enzyme [Victivallales bacterium]|nr:SUMF1/EgtB/PvdO family nonheme iron enzyme [Victivallales bacterium]
MMNDEEALKNNELRPQILSQGDTVGEVYEVIKIIGQSALDDAYLVRNRVTGKRYVLKRLLREYTSDDDYEELFDRLKSKVGDFIHPNIVGIHKVGHTDDDYYLVSSYVSALGGKSRTLYERISRQGKVHEFQAKNIFLQICGGLHHALRNAKNGTFHWDLKPSNILFDNALVRISDFSKFCLVPEAYLSRILKDSGMSRDSLREHGVPLRMLPPVHDIEDTESTSKINMHDFAVVGVEDTAHRYSILHSVRNRNGERKKTMNDHIREKRLNALLETYEFMSPEQKSGNPPGELGNIYSLGLILYFMLTGNKVNREKYIPPSKCGCNVIWDDIVKHCIDPNPAKRYQSIDKLQYEVIQRKAKKWHYLPLAIYSGILITGGILLYLAIAWVYNPSKMDEIDMLNRAIQESGVDISNRYSVFHLRINPPGSFVEIFKDGIAVHRVQNSPEGRMKVVLPPGNYVLEANKSGYKLLREPLKLNSGNFNIELTLSENEVLSARQYVYKEGLSKPELGFPYKIPNTDIELLPIDKGTFVMGSHANVVNFGIHEKTPRQASINYKFWMSRAEIDQKTYERIMLENPSIYTSATGKLPVEKVSWRNAQEFIRRLNLREKEQNRLPEGYAYRLPDEIEWEYVCRAETTSDYYFGNSSKQLGDFAWYFGNSFNQTHEIGSKLPNRWGFYNMHGNVAEWTLSSYPAEDGKARYIVRGGSWKDSPARLRSSARHEMNSDTYSDNHIGFRIVLAPEMESD